MRKQRIGLTGSQTNSILELYNQCATSASWNKFSMVASIHVCAQKCENLHNPVSRHSSQQHGCVCTSALPSRSRLGTHCPLYCSQALNKKEASGKDVDSNDESNEPYVLTPRTQQNYEKINKDFAAAMHMHSVNRPSPNLDRVSERLNCRPVQVGSYTLPS